MTIRSLSRHLDGELTFRSPSGRLDGELIFGSLFGRLDGELTFGSLSGRLDGELTFGRVELHLKCLGGALTLGRLNSKRCQNGPRSFELANSSTKSLVTAKVNRVFFRMNIGGINLPSGE